MENEVVVEPTDGLDEAALDAAIESMVDKATERIVEQEASRSANSKGLPELTTKGEKPRVEGERVPRWENRSFRYIHGVLKRQSNEVELQEQGKHDLLEYARQTRSMTAWQRDEEADEIADAIASSSLSKRVQKRLHSTLTGPAGEFALPKPFLSELFVIIEEYGLARRLARVVNMQPSGS